MEKDNDQNLTNLTSDKPLTEWKWARRTLLSFDLLKNPFGKDNLYPKWITKNIEKQIDKTIKLK